MTVRATVPVDDPEESVTVTVAAHRLGCDDSTVRAMLRSRQLSGHHVGKGKKPGGVRVDAASIRAYKRRHSLGGQEVEDETPERRDPSGRPTAAHNEAMALLRELGAV